MLVTAKKRIFTELYMSQHDIIGLNIQLDPRAIIVVSESESETERCTSAANMLQLSWNELHSTFLLITMVTCTQWILSGKHSRLYQTFLVKKARIFLLTWLLILFLAIYNGNMKECSRILKLIIPTKEDILIRILGYKSKNNIK